MAVLLTLGAVAAVVIESRGTPDEELAADALRADAADLARTTRLVTEAKTVEQLREAGRRTRSRLPALAPRLRALGDLDDDDVVDPAVEAHRRVEVVMTGYSELADLRQADLEPWVEGAEELLIATNALRDGLASRVARFDDDDPVRLPHARAREAILEAARYLQRADRRLERWRRARAGYLRRRSSAVTDATGYRDDVRVALARVSDTREDLRQAAGNDLDARELRRALRRARSRFARAQRELAAAAATAPGRVQDEHASLVALAARATRLARVGNDPTEGSGGLPFGGDDDAPLERLVQEIGEGAQATLRAWDLEIDRYVRRLGGNPPRRPRV